MTGIPELEETLHFLEKARDEAASVAAWALKECTLSPGWRWIRRRFLSAVWERKHREALELAGDVAAAKAELHSARARTRTIRASKVEAGQEVLVPDALVNGVAVENGMPPEYSDVWLEVDSVLPGDGEVALGLAGDPPGVVWRLPVDEEVQVR